MSPVWRHVVVSLCLISSIAYSQERFETIPEGIKKAYHIDFSRLFFSNRSQERLDYERLQSMLTEMESFEGRLVHSPDNLLLALKLNDSLQVK